MPAATVVVMDGKHVADVSGAVNDSKTLQNTLSVTGGGAIASRGVYKVTIDASSLADGAGETQQVTGCTGVVLGRTAVVGIANPADALDVTISAYVQANGVIEVRFQNESGATADIASGVYYILTETVAAGL